MDLETEAILVDWLDVMIEKLETELAKMRTVNDRLRDRGLLGEIPRPALWLVPGGKN
jgi:hypothetical protein